MVRERERKRGYLKHLSVHQWVRSAIRDWQQPISPIGFLFLKLPPPPCAVLLVNNSSWMFHSNAYTFVYYSVRIYVYMFAFVCLCVRVCLEILPRNPRMSWHQQLPWQFNLGELFRAL